MRVLPVLADRRSGDTGPFAYWKEGERARHALVLFRCYEVSLYVNSLTKSDPIADAGATDAAFAATGAAASVGAAFAVRTASALAADAAARSVALAASAAAARVAAFASAASALAGAFATALSADVGQLGKEFSEEDMVALLISPLWAKGAPSEFSNVVGGTAD